MKINPWITGTVGLALALSGCAEHRPGTSSLGTACGAAPSHLSADWRALNELMESPGACAPMEGNECAALRSKIERLSVDCPNYPDVLMANALLAFGDRNFVRAQQLIDEMLGLGYSFPEAVVLRARIALVQGNVRFALRFLDERIKEMGANSSIRETYASALFVARRWDEAETQLDIAARLGAPEWRLAYGRGLIEEAEGNFVAAKALYQQALRSKPGWPLAQERLKALQATGKAPE